MSFYSFSKDCRVDEQLWLVSSCGGGRAVRGWSVLQWVGRRGDEKYVKGMDYPTQVRSVGLMVVAVATVYRYGPTRKPQEEDSLSRFSGGLGYQDCYQAGLVSNPGNPKLL